MERTVALIEQARLLAARLERLTPDSPWAHKASGCRGTLLRLIERLERGLHLQSPSRRTPTPPKPADLLALEAAIQHGFQILESAAKDRFGRPTWKTKQ